MNQAAAEQEIGRVGDELFAHWASEDLTAASMIGRISDRIGAPAQADSNLTTSKAVGWATRLEALRSTELRGPVELTRRYLRFEVGKLADAAQLHRFDFQITPYRIGHVLAEVHRHMESIAFSDASDVDRYDTLLGQYDKYLIDTLQNLRAQASMGVVAPAAALPACLTVIKGLAGSLTQSLTVSPERLSHVSQAHRSALTSNVERALTQLRLKFDDLCSYIEGDYSRQASQTLGLAQYPGGCAAYQTLIRHHTTLGLSADEVHRMGEELVREVEEDMARLRSQLGFTGTQQEFLQHVKNNPRFYCRSAEELGELYLRSMKKCEAALPRAFGSRAFQPYGVKRLPSGSEGGMTFGYYQAPMIGGEQVGYYMYNGANLEQRPIIGAAGLIYHELVPGHHLHVSLEIGDVSRPLVRRFPTITAFSEGWAEYAADLGFELGLYDDLYEKYGRYLLQVFLASRLVVDTGLNMLGWTAQRARDYLLEHTAQSPKEIDSEILRYASGMPGQALAYAPGRKHFWQARRDAERTLGSRFNLISFHDTILDGGSLPLEDLSFSVSRWATEYR